MFAVVKTGGKQYKVANNDLLKVEKLEGEVGQTVTLDNVLLVKTDKGITTGEAAAKESVKAEIIEQKRDKKVIIFKKKRRKNHRRKNGHRQSVTIVRITEIAGVKAEALKKTEKKADKPAKAKEEKKAAPKKEPKAEATKTDAPKKEAKATKEEEK